MATRLAGRLKNFAGVAVSFKRGKLAAIAMTVTAANQEYEVVDQEGFSTRVVSRDFTFTLADLDFVPRPGDRIIETIGGVEQTFEAMSVGDKPCFESLDDYGVMGVVHTKRVA